PPLLPLLRLCSLSLLLLSIFLGLLRSLGRLGNLLPLFELGLLCKLGQALLLLLLLFLRVLFRLGLLLRGCQPLPLSNGLIAPCLGSRAAYGRHRGLDKGGGRVRRGVRGWTV